MKAAGMELWTLPHHDGSARYVPEQAPSLGDVVPVFVRVPAASPVRRVYLRSVHDGEPTFREAVVDRRDEHGDTWWRAEVRVSNPVTNYRFLLDQPDGNHWLTGLGVVGHDVSDQTDFRLVTYEPPPVWARDSVIYQIFPDRFARSPQADRRPLPDWAIPCDWERTPVIGRGPETPYQFYGGDLDGIAARLDHLDRLGVNAVYLTPIFPARSNHRYDAVTFDSVDPLLGGDAALARLADAVHARGWRLIGDITTNHTGDGHEWFAAAIADVRAPERQLFYFDPETGDYECWNGVKSLPKLNWGSTELRRRFLDGPEAVVRRWLLPPYRLDGWRVDVANMTGRRGAEAYTHEVAALVRAAVTDARPDALVVAEHGHDYTRDLDADGWHGTMNYPGFTEPVWQWLIADGVELPSFLGTPGGVRRRDAIAVLAAMRGFAALVSWRSYTHSWQLLGSHDSARIRSVVGDAVRQEVAVGLLMTMPGIPMVFAGDELGLRGENGEGSRTPMPWHAPQTWDHATFDRYRALIALRRAEPALRHGGLRWMYVDADTLVFLRETPADALLVLARRAAANPVKLVGLSAGDNVYGGAPALRPRDGAVLVPGDGPTFQVWRVNR
jgi:alpha-glucosidase